MAPAGFYISQQVKFCTVKSKGEQTFICIPKIIKTEHLAFYKKMWYSIFICTETKVLS